MQIIIPEPANILTTHLLIRTRPQGHANKTNSVAFSPQANYTD
jgi:hypothetical protein